MKIRSDVPFCVATPEEQAYMEWLRKLGVKFQYKTSDQTRWNDIEISDVRPLGGEFELLHYRLKPTDDP